MIFLIFILIHNYIQCSYFTAATYSLLSYMTRGAVAILGKKKRVENLSF